jgi:hypothetical protein
MRAFTIVKIPQRHKVFRNPKESSASKVKNQQTKEKDIR